MPEIRRIIDVAGITNGDCISVSALYIKWEVSFNNTVMTHVIRVDLKEAVILKTENFMEEKILVVDFWVTVV
jgi:hypothetical protein